jgi:hypothetical protein
MMHHATCTPAGFISAREKYFLFDRGRPDHVWSEGLGVPVPRNKIANSDFALATGGWYAQKERRCS